MEDKIKILIYNPGLWGGGRERRTVQLIKGLNAFDWIDVSVMINYRKKAYDEFYETKARLYYQEERNDRHKIYKNIDLILQEVKPDIVHSWCESPRDMMPLLQLKNQYKYKLIAGFVADGNRTGVLTRQNFFNQYYYYNSEAIVSNSKIGLRAKHAPVKKSYYIPNGFDFARFDGIKDSLTVRKELEVPDDVFIVTMCARFTKDKDWGSFLKIAQKAQYESLPTKFIAAGSGPLYEYFVSEAKEKKIENILFLGQRNDVESILCASDICLLLTTGAHQEGFSNSILEAMAAGLPTLASKSGGTPEVIDEGVNGFLVPVEDWNASYNHLLRLINNKDEMLAVGKQARLKVENTYTLPLMTERYIDLYKKLLKIDNLK